MFCIVENCDAKGATIYVFADNYLKQHAQNHKRMHIVFIGII